MTEITRFIKDKNRGISLNLFAELCGISKKHFFNVFVYRKDPMTEWTQIRVSKGYNEWKAGNVAVMQNRDTTRFVEYRREPKPRMVRGTGLQMVNGEIKIKVGIRNVADYSQPDLDEQLRRG
jgi:hypothetical protein